jgi:predicted metalloprotease
MARWDKIKSRGNVTDKRGLAAGGIGSLGVVGIVAVLAINLLGGGELDLNNVLTQLQEVQPQSTSQVQPEEFRGEDDYETFVSTVLGSNNDVWEQVFTNAGSSYEPPQLVLFRGATASGCGTATSSVGPHYCPANSTIYIDETFFDVLSERFGARGGDVAEAYVISHEVGHHVQNELGSLDKSQQSNELAVKVELQADCFAGVWASSLKGQGIFEPNEFSEAIDAAEAVGDDRIQEKTTGRVNPESWTHGSSEERKRWLQVGYESGDPARCTP